MTQFWDVPFAHNMFGIIGRPGSGKTTLVRRFIQEHQPYAGMIRSFTTRAPRVDDDSREYEYLTEEQLSELRETGEVTWCVEAHGHHYGNVFSQFRTALLQYEYSLIVVTPDTVPIAWRVLPQDRQHYFFLLSPDDYELYNRMIDRGDSPEVAQRRVETSSNWNDEALALQRGGWPVNFIEAGSKEFQYQQFCDALNVPV
jgi:guanylate kinase